MSGYQIIKKASAAMVGILGKQKYDECSSYRISQFTIVTECDQGTLYHSCMTGELLIVTDEKQARQYLIESWLYVLDTIDEKAMLPNIKKLLRCLSKKQGDGYKTFEIITTTICNAQCYYCYEAGFKHMSISYATSEKIVEFIDNHKLSDQIKIKWYGGEPLMNIKAIDAISKGLSNKGIKFSSSMISNGLLFSEPVISKAHKLWNLQNVRITIDGTEQVYNQTKNYKKCSGSAYQTIIENINCLLAYGISVTIRLNIETGNILDVKELIQRLSTTYKDNELIDFMLRPLNNTATNNKIESVGSERELLLKEITSMKEDLFNSGFLVNCGKLTGLTLCTCIADSRTYIAIKPNGDLAYCSSDFDNKTFGSVFLDSKVIPFPELSKYPHEKKEICNDCPLYPTCSPSKLCPACIKPICSASQKAYNIADVILTMKKEYRIFKTKHYED